MVIAYVRVSTEKQHLSGQRSEIERYTKAHGFSIDKWIEEVVSGKTDKTMRLLGSTINSLHKGDVLVVTELSRLSRSLHEIMLIMKYCVENGVVVHSTKDGYVFDDSINSKVLSFAFGLSAEIEHKLISQRTKEGLASRKAEGKHVGRGFGSDYKFQQLIKSEKEILSLISKNKKINSICKQLNISVTLFRRLRKQLPAIEAALKERKKD